MDGKDSVMFSKKSDEWETPKELFNKLDKEFHFNGDMAATSENRLCAHYCTRESDALKYDWVVPSLTNVFFLNPPYSQIGSFIKKAYEESQKGATVVCLIPSRTDTKYWHDYCMKALEIRFIKGRLKFGNRSLPKTQDTQFKLQDRKISSAPFPSCIVIFKPGVYTPTISSFFQS